MQSPPFSVTCPTPPSAWSEMNYITISKLTLSGPVMNIITSFLGVISFTCSSSSSSPLSAILVCFASAAHRRSHLPEDVQLRVPCCWLLPLFFFSHYRCSPFLRCFTRNEQAREPFHDCPCCRSCSECGTHWSDGQNFKGSIVLTSSSEAWPSYPCPFLEGSFQHCWREQSPDVLHRLPSRNSPSLPNVVEELKSACTFFKLVWVCRSS